MSKLITTKDGFMFMNVTDKAREIFKSETFLFELYALIVSSEDLTEISESLIKTEEELNKHLENGWTIAIEVGQQDPSTMTINAVELASELASEELEYKYTDQIVIYHEEENGDTRYTEEAQDIFNDLYDKRYSQIESTKI